MTTKDAILKLADAVSGNTSANVVTDVQALAVLAQAMTGGVPAEPLATVDDAIEYIADNYSGGGGGGGDFTTASVVFSLDGYTGAPFTLHVPYTFYNEILSETVIDCAIASSEMDGETAFDLMLYKGKLYIEAPNGIFSAATGDIDITEGWEATITGDGTLNISDEP